MSFKIFLIWILFSSLGCYAKEFLVVINNEYDKKRVDIPELDGKNRFENEDFKIVYKKKNEAISVDEPNRSIKLKAATLFYNLLIAKKYFKDLMQDDFPNNREPLVVRVDLAASYDKEVKYVEGEDHNYNTALSIPPSLPRSRKKWGHEIWFRPAKLELKKVSSNELVEQGLKIYDVLATSDHYIRTLRIVDKVIKDETENIEEDLLNLTENYIADKAYRYALEYVLNKINYGVSYLETALNNEVIFHEYTHIVFSDYISIRGPLTLGEGIANFYATQISNGDDIAQDISRYSFTAGKAAYTKLKYSKKLEKEKYAQQDFAYSLLFQMGQILEDESEGVYHVDEYMFHIVKALESKRPLKLYPDFTDRVVRKCRDLCQNPFTSKIKLNHLMEQLGIPR